MPLNHCSKFRILDFDPLSGSEALDFALKLAFKHNLSIVKHFTRLSCLLFKLFYWFCWFCIQFWRWLSDLFRNDFLLTHHHFIHIWFFCIGRGPILIPAFSHQLCKGRNQSIPVGLFFLQSFFRQRIEVRLLTFGTIVGRIGLRPKIKRGKVHIAFTNLMSLGSHFPKLISGEGIGRRRFYFFNDRIACLEMLRIWLINNGKLLFAFLIEDRVQKLERRNSVGLGSLFWHFMKNLLSLAAETGKDVFCVYRLLALALCLIYVEGSFVMILLLLLKLVDQLSYYLPTCTIN